MPCKHFHKGNYYDYRFEVDTYYKLWNHTTYIDKRQLGRLQRKCMKFCAFVLDMNCPPYDYSPVLWFIELKIFS